MREIDKKHIEETKNKKINEMPDRPKRKYAGNMVQMMINIW